MVDELTKSLCKKIKLGDREFLIGKLGPRQNRIVLPGAMKLLRIFGPLYSTLMEIKKSGVDVSLPELISMLDDLNMDSVMLDLLSDVVYAAITKIQPEFKRAEFDDLPQSLQDQFMALQVILWAAGMSTEESSNDPVPPVPGAQEPGEARAQSQTGTG